MIKVSPCFPTKTKDQYASTDNLMATSMTIFNAKISYTPKIEKTSEKINKTSPFKNILLLSKCQRIERKPVPKLKNFFNGSFYKENFYQISDQESNKRQKILFRINKKKNNLDEVIFDKRKKIREQKHQMSPQLLESSKLSEIYSYLYEAYERVPFQEEIKDHQSGNQTSKNLQQYENREQKDKKMRKKFQVKQLNWQNNLRKEIKLLTKDTDNILSIAFRDVRDVSRR